MKKKLLDLASSIYGKAVLLNRKLYDRGFFHSERLSVPIISIGNLTWGGTGKTPFLIYLADHFLSSGKKVLVLSRGYGGRLSKSFGVITKEMLTREAGDEPLLIRNSFPSPCLQVIVGRNRAETGKMGVELFHPDVVLLDDGFGHRRLKRDLDVVILDALNPFGNFHTLPGGILREPLSSLGRADVFLINRLDLLEDPDDVQQQIRDILPAGVPVFSIRQKIARFDNFHTGNPVSPDAFTGREVIAVSAIGSPASFERLLQKHSLRCLHHFSFRDHHVYIPGDREDILRTLVNHPGAAIITTAKDAVKLRTLFRDPSVPLYILQIEAVFDPPSDEEIFTLHIDKSMERTT